jgi:TetR/AcrR family transcriptional regulator, cholesterol catabolism regulator
MFEKRGATRSNPADFMSAARPKQKRLAPEIRAHDILVAALDLFAERDLSSVSIREIAAKCGVNVGLIYYYFENKEVLFEASIKQAIQEPFERYQARAMDPRDPIKSLNDWLQINIELFGNLRKMVKVLIDYNFSAPNKASIDALIRNFYDQEKAFLARCIVAGTSLRLVRTVDAERAAVFISTYLDGLIMVSMTRPWTDVGEQLEEARLVIWDYLGVREPK